MQMHFVQETPNKRKNSENRRRVSSLAAQAAWANKLVQKSQTVQGSNVWVVGSRPSASVSPKATNQGGRKRNYVQSVFKVQQARNDVSNDDDDHDSFPKLLHHISTSCQMIIEPDDPRRSILVNALEYYCYRVAPMISKMTLYGVCRAHTVGTIDPTLFVTLPQIASVPLFRDCVLAMSISYKDRLMVLNHATPAGFAFLQLRHRIIVDIQDRVANKHCNSLTAFAIGCLIFIDATCGRGRTFLGLHSRGLAKVLQAVEKEAEIGSKTDLMFHFCLNVARKASLIASMRFFFHEEDTASEQITVGSAVEETLERPPVFTAALPCGIVDLAQSGHVSTAALYLIDEFSAWAQLVIMNSESIKLYWTPHPTTIPCQKSGFDMEAEACLDGPWRPMKIDSRFTNLEKLILLTLTTIADMLLDIHNWPMWKFHQNTWRLLIKDLETDYPPVKMCVIWCMTVVLSQTSDNLIDERERFDLFNLMKASFPSESDCNDFVRESLKQFHWFPDEMESWLSLWGCRPDTGTLDHHTASFEWQLEQHPV